MEALQAAFDETARLRDIARKGIGNAGSALIGGRASPLQISTLSNANQQYLKGAKGWAYVAVRAISQKIAGQNLFVGRLSNEQPKKGRRLALPDCFKGIGDKIEPIENHPLLRVFAKPNRLMTKWGLIVSLVTSLELTGRSFLWKTGDEIVPLPSNWIEPADAERNAWKIHPKGSAESFDVPASEIAHFCLPNPADPFGCVSPLQSQSAAVATDESIQESQFRAFKNGVLPGLLIKAGRLPGMISGEQGELRILEPEQRKELVDSILAIYGGAVNHGEPLIIDGMIEGVEKLTTSPNEMDWLDSGKQIKSRILQAFGVNAAIVGELENVNRASAVVAEKSFCANVINPLIQLLSETLSAWASELFGESLIVWLEKCRADDDELTLQAWESAARLGFVNQNEFRNQVLNIESVSGGDVFRNALGEPITTSERSTNNRLTAYSGNGRGSK